MISGVKNGIEESEKESFCTFSSGSNLGFVKLLEMNSLRGWGCERSKAENESCNGVYGNVTNCRRGIGAECVDKGCSRVENEVLERGMWQCRDLGKGHERGFGAMASDILDKNREGIGPEGVNGGGS